jgi:hypothetical protein
MTRRSNQSCVNSDRADFLPFHLCKVFAVHSLSTLPVGLIGAEVDSPFCQDPLLHDPCSLVELSFLYILLEVIHMGADTDLMTCGVLYTHVLSSCISGEKPCVRIDSRRCSDRAVG